MTTKQARKLARMYNRVFLYGEEFTHPLHGAVMTVGPALVWPATKHHPTLVQVDYRFASDGRRFFWFRIDLADLLTLLAVKYPPVIPRVRHAV